MAARGRPCVLCTSDLWMAVQRVVLFGREGLTLHAVHRLPSDFTVSGIVDMHHNGFSEVMLNGSERYFLNAVHI